MTPPLEGGQHSATFGGVTTAEGNNHNAGVEVWKPSDNGWPPRQSSVIENADNLFTEASQEIRSINGVSSQMKENYI